MSIIDYEVTSGAGMTPKAHVDLDRKLASAARQYKPGNMIKLVLVGSIESLTLSKPVDPEESGYEGSLCLKVTRAEILESARNQMAELLDDDE